MSYETIKLRVKSGGELIQQQLKAAGDEWRANYPFRLQEQSARTINDAYEALRIARTHYTMAVTLLMDRENIRDKRRAEIINSNALADCKNELQRDAKLRALMAEELRAVHLAEESKAHNQMDYEIARDNVARLDLLVRAGLPVLSLDDLPESTPPLDGKPDAP